MKCQHGDTKFTEKDPPKSSPPPPALETSLQMLMQHCRELVTTVFRNSPELML